MEMDEFEGEVGVEGMVCELCGSNQFALEGGFFFCQVCQTQSQDTRQFVEREEYTPGGLRTTAAATLREPGKGRKNGERKVRMLNFEALNCCLKLMTDKLIALGFPKELKDQVFFLWTKYLIKRQAIFIDKEGNKGECYKSLGSWTHGPACGCHYRDKWKKKCPPRLRRKIMKKEEVELDETLISITAAKKRRTRSQLKTMAAEYSSQLAEVKGEPPQPETEVKTTNEKAKHLLIRRACKLTRHSRLVLVAMKREGFIKSDVAQSLLSPELFPLKSALVLIFLALRQIGCSVLMSDVVRLVWSGSLYFSSLRLVFGEENTNINSTIDGIFAGRKNSYMSILMYEETILDLINYLGLGNFWYPTFKEFLPKFIDDLSLPMELECFVLQMQKLLPMERKGFLSQDAILKSCKVLPEFLILGIIIVTLKLFFGMDDVTERYQSDFAKAVNALLNKRAGSNDTDWKRLFVPEDWLLYLRRRHRIFKSELFSPPFCHSLRRYPAGNLQQIVGSYAGLKGPNYDKPEMEMRRVNVTQVFHNYAEKSKPPHLPSNLPSYSPISLPEDELLHSYQDNHPNVVNPENLKDIVSTFAKSRINFIINPDKYVKMLTEAGYQVKVLPGDARQYPDLRDLEKNAILLFQPFKAFDVHMPKYFSYPATLKFLVDLCSTVVSGNHCPQRINRRVEKITDRILNYYRVYQRNGAYSIFSFNE